MKERREDSSMRGDNGRYVDEGEKKNFAHERREDSSKKERRDDSSMRGDNRRFVHVWREEKIRP